MKKYLLAILCAVILMKVEAQVPAGVIQNQINKVLDIQQKAWNDGSVEQFMAGYWHHDSLRFVTKKGIKYGWQAMLDGYKKSYPNKATMGVLTFGILEMQQLGKDRVLVTGTWEVAAEKGLPAGQAGKQGGLFTLVFRKFKSGWLIVLDHTS